MLKRSLLAILFCFGLTTARTNAQAPCPAGMQSDKLICVIPQVYGINGLRVANPAASGKFNSSFLNDSLRPVASSIARQAALLPLASPSAGITFSWDPVSKTFVSSTDSFGPIFAERAETIGRYKVFVGFDYQYLKFNSIDGVSLKSLPLLFTQPDDNVSVPGTTCSINASPTSPQNTGNCGFIRDVIKSVNNVDLKIQQFTTFVTFGLTNRIDISVAIPIENVRMKVSSDLTITHNDSPTRFDHAFVPRTGCQAVCLEQPFSNPGTASGIGDITLRVKGTAWKSERAALALGVDVRVPTGDQLNFLGAGAAGVKPFLVWSYRSPYRISPHILVGYETNGSSKVAGDISTGVKERLPGQLTYSSGADVWINKWFTTAFDLVGQQVFQAQRTSIKSVADLGACDSLSCQNPNSPVSYATLSTSTGTFNITNASVGFKVKPFSNLLITCNVMVKLNEGGLRANVVPLGGLSYTF